MTTIDRAALAEFNAGVRAARNEYAAHPSSERCTEDATCYDCRVRARDDLRVATSVDECAQLLAIIDRPALVRRAS